MECVCSLMCLKGAVSILLCLENFVLPDEKSEHPDWFSLVIFLSTFSSMSQEVFLKFNVIHKMDTNHQLLFQVIEMFLKSPFCMEVAHDQPCLVVVFRSFKLEQPK